MSLFLLMAAGPRHGSRGAEYYHMELYSLNRVKFFFQNLQEKHYLYIFKLDIYFNLAINPPPVLAPPKEPPNAPTIFLPLSFPFRPVYIS